MDKYKVGRAEVVVRLMEDAAPVVIRCVLTGAYLSIAREYATVREPGGSTVLRDVVAETFEVSGTVAGGIEVVGDSSNSCGDSKEVSDSRIRLIRFLRGGSKDDC